MVSESMQRMVINLKKHLKIYSKLFAFSLSTEVEYRLSFLITILVELAYFFVTLVSARVIFWNVNDIAGWNYNELLVLLGINMVFSEIILGLAFVFNLRELPYKIARGTLDLVLTKPINSQFSVSLWRPYFAMFPGILAGLIVAYGGFTKLGQFPSFLLFAPFLVVFVSGLVMAYSVGMMITTISMWFINASPLAMLAQQFIQLSKNPYSVFTGAWKLVFITVLPIAFMVSFPSSILLGQLDVWWMPASIVLAITFLKLSSTFWNFALKKYSGASS